MSCFVVTDSKLSSFWSLVTDIDKQIFSNDKFLSQASNDGECIDTS